MKKDPFSGVLDAMTQNFGTFTDNGFNFDAVALDSAADDLGEKVAIANAMGAVLTWVEEGDFSFDMMDAIVQGVSDLDEDGEQSDDEEELYRDTLSIVGDAMVALGANSDAVTTFLEEGTGGDELGEFLTDKLDDSKYDDYELISRFAAGTSSVLDSAFRKVRAVRNGVVKIVKRSLTKVRLSAAQKAALRKARMKANTGMAKRARKRSMKARKNRGM